MLCDFLLRSFETLLQEPLIFGKLPVTLLSLQEPVCRDARRRRLGMTGPDEGEKRRLVNPREPLRSLEELFE
eukprot:10790775-Alexandrium_andersonii.AAC.1